MVEIEKKRGANEGRKGGANGSSQEKKGDF